MSKISRPFTALILMFGLAVVPVLPQAEPNPIPPPETIAAGALVIPMDNVNQGNAAGTTFDIRAYGLANRLLQNNVPLKWAINPGKSKDDVDFTAAVTRIAGTNGVASGNVSFSGGPFIVPPEYATLAKTLIATFNNEMAGDITVYELTADASVDVRYNVTHKPLIAVGPDGGNFGSGVYQALFDEARITNYAPVTDESMQATSCYTLAAQAHSVSTMWVSSYRSFVENGGNLILQCASVNTFENNLSFGLFQTTAGYTVFGTNTPDDVSGSLIYPNGFMPFNQFRGPLNGNQTGAVTDFVLGPGSSFVNGTLVSAQHSGGVQNDLNPNPPHPGAPNAFVATVSKVANVGRAGGNVFELGGHSYDLGDPSALGNINGKRMILNTIFVPVTRPCSELSIPTVEGYKSVILAAAGPTGDIAPVGELNQGDTVIWEITYINRGGAAATNFQITDVIPTGLSITSVGAHTVMASGGVSIAAKNLLYDGAGNNNMLAPGAILDVGGKITIHLPTKVNVPEGVFANQPTANGINVPEGGVKTDNIDDTDTIVYTGGNITSPTGSFSQDVFQSPNIDPTIISLVGPSAADGSIEGRVVTFKGIGIAGAAVIVTDPETGAVQMARTNGFGYYRFDGLETGTVYLISVSAKRHRFDEPSRLFSLTDSLTGFDFVAGR